MGLGLLPSWTPCALAPRGWGYPLPGQGAGRINNYGAEWAFRWAGGILIPLPEPYERYGCGNLRHEELVKAARMCQGAR